MASATDPGDLLDSLGIEFRNLALEFIDPTLGFLDLLSLLSDRLLTDHVKCFCTFGLRGSKLSGLWLGFNNFNGSNIWLLFFRHRKSLLVQLNAADSYFLNLDRLLFVHYVTTSDSYFLNFDRHLLIHCITASDGFLFHIDGLLLEDCWSLSLNIGFID